MLIHLLVPLITGAIARAYPLLPTTPRFSCEELILGAQRGAPYDGRVLRAFKTLIEWRLAVKITGAEEILNAADGRGMILLANHSDPLDPVLMLTQLGPLFAMRPVMTGNLRGFPLTDRLLGATAGFIQPEPSTGGVTNARLIQAQFDEVANATRHGDVVFFYPSGYAQTSPTEHLAAQSMTFEVLRRDPNARVVLARVRGLWGSATSHGAKSARRDHLLTTAERIAFGLKRGALILAANGPFAPKRPVTIELVEPGDFPRHGTRAEINAYLTAFYNGGASERRTFVKPHFLWPGPTLTHGDESFTYGAADRRWTVTNDDADAVDPELVDAVVAVLRTTPRLHDATATADLGDSLDSLAKVDVFLALMHKFGVRLDDDARFKDARDLARLVARARVKPRRRLEQALVASEPWFSADEPPARGVKKLKRWARRERATAVGILGPLGPRHALARALDALSIRFVTIDATRPPAEVMRQLDDAGARTILTTAPLLREIARSYDVSEYLHRVRLVTDPAGSPPLP